MDEESDLDDTDCWALPPLPNWAAKWKTAEVVEEVEATPVEEAKADVVEDAKAEVVEEAEAEVVEAVVEKPAKKAKKAEAPVEPEETN